MKFEWDEEKNKINIAKHKVSFEEAKMVFYDENALLIYDVDHSDDEDRFVIIGRSPEERELVVCHCIREKSGEEVIRIINAREADNDERRAYYERKL